MPIGAEQWRVVTGMNNARYTLRPARSPVSPSKYLSRGTLSWRACVALLQALLILALNTDWWGPWVGCVFNHRVREPVEKVVGHLCGGRPEGYSAVRFYVPTLRILLIVAGDVEQNPGPPKPKVVPLILPNVIGICDTLRESGFRVSEWESLASRLGVRDPGSIRYKYQHNAALCLEETIRQWLHIEVATPTWDKLATEVSKVEGYGEGTKRTILELSIGERSGVISPSEHSLVNGATAGGVENHHVVAVARRNIQNIQMKFRHLRTLVRKKLENKQVHPLDFSDFLIELYSPHWVTGGPGFVNSVLGSAAKLDDMFRALTLHGLWDYRNYHLLASVIYEFADDDHELHVELGDYQKDFTGYVLVTYIQHHLHEVQYDSIPSTTAELDSTLFSRLSLKVHVAISDHTLAYVYDLWESLSRHCALPPPTLLLHQIADGSIGITWLMPSILVTYFETTVKELGNYFAENHIQKVTLDGRVIYSVDVQEAEATTMSLEAQKKDEDRPFLEEYADSSEMAEIMKDPDAIPEVLQEQLQTKVLYRNFTLLYLHLDSLRVKPKLLHNEIVNAMKAEELHSYTSRCAQNFILISALFNYSAMSQIVLKLCDILATTPGQEALAKRMLKDIKLVMPSPSQVIQHTPRICSSDFCDLSDQFALTLRHTISTFNHVPDALQKLTEILGSIVLPLGEGNVVPLVEPQAYEKSLTVRELFRCLCNHYNPLSISLLQALVELSECTEAEQTLSEYTNTLTSKQHLLLCIRHSQTEDQQNDLNVSTKQVISAGHKSAHEAPLEKLQSLHPAVFTHLPEHRPVSPRPATRITVEIDQPALCLSEYEDIVLAVCAVFKLPTLALVYCGCSTAPLVLCWSISTSILSKIKQCATSLTACRMLAEQRVVAIAVGDDIQYKCPSMKEVEYHEACTYGLVERIPDLLQAGVYVDATLPDGDRGLIEAARRGKREVIKLLLCNGADPNDRCQTTMGSPLMVASVEGHESVVKVLLDAGADPNYQKKGGMSPLMFAADSGHEGIVQLLLKAGAKPNLQDEDGDSALALASSGGYLRIAELLLDKGADPNLQRKITGDTALTVASYKAHNEVVKLLLKEGADVNLQKKDGTSALLLATEARHDITVNTLLNAKADPNLPEETYGGSPLIKASYNGSKSVVQVLLHAGADPNYQRKDGMSPLMFAANCGHEHIAQQLLEAGANPNLQDEDGDSALTLALYRNDVRIAELLLEKGADPNLQTNDGETVFDIASERGYTELCQLMLQSQH